MRAAAPPPPQVKARLNLHGLVSVESVQALEEEEYEETVAAPPAPATKPAEPAAAPADADTKMEDADAAKGECAERVEWVCASAARSASGGLA
jgi:hypothetical protein